MTMKKLLILIILIIVGPRIYAPTERVIFIESPPGINPYLELYQATCFVESSYRPDAINQQEQAYGLVQIRQCKLDDYNKETGKNYTLQDCLVPEISKEIYMHFASKFDHKEYELIAKKWNGSGPMTGEYWKKVMKQWKKEIR